MSGSHNQADLTAIIGATGSGKSTRIKLLLESERPRRLMVWDWKAEYDMPVVAVADLHLVVKESGNAVVSVKPTKEIARAIYQGRMRAENEAAVIARMFDQFCNVALDRGNLMVIAEELSNVTTASWAPLPWRRVCTEGRHSALRIIGTTQRPALCDKTFIDAATVIMCGRLNSSSSKAYMADAMDVAKADIAALGQFQWIAKDTQSGRVWRADLEQKKPGRVRR